MSRINGSHAFVTGGASGIGLAIAKTLASQGARVTIASRNIDRINEVAASVDGISGIAVDVTDPDSVEAAVASSGPVDTLVNNAGIALAAPFERTTLEQLTEVMAVNLAGVFHCTQAVLPAMRKRNYGRIVNIASTAGLRGYAYTSIYSASKHAIIGLTRSLALELARTGITANCVCPGFTDTEIVATAITNISRVTGRTEAEALAELVNHNPQKRLVTAEEVADTVLWLCGENSRSINGQAIAVAGGEIM
jgi:NAD(P)-dependent dehydrogenase (short-subunit alcohol dehydrogenase family)